MVNHKEEKLEKKKKSRPYVKIVIQKKKKEVGRMILCH